MIILELNTAHLKLIAHLLHMHLVANAENENPIGRDLLDFLMQQTDFIHKEPEKHNVFPYGRVDAIRSNSVWYVPIDGEGIV
jgi:hypothetical protein